VACIMVALLHVAPKRVSKGPRIYILKPCGRSNDPQGWGRNVRLEHLPAISRWPRHKRMNVVAINSGGKAGGGSNRLHEIDTGHSVGIKCFE